MGFADRFKIMGDIAEGAFKRVAESEGITVVEFGLKRPPIKRFTKLHAHVRTMPDYLCETNRLFFCECKGCGARGVKIKLESLEALQEWNKYHEVQVFIYNSKADKYVFVSMTELIEACANAKVDRFEVDKKEFYQIPLKTFTWLDMPQGVQTDASF